MITELIANAINHAELPPAADLTMTVDSDPARVRVGLSHPYPVPIEAEPAGIGLMLVQRLARRWGIEWDDGTAEVWFEVRAAGTGAALTHLSDLEVLGRAMDDELYRDEAVSRFSGLAVGVSRRFRGKGVADSDLEQVALLGLINAMARFDPEKGAFEPFAVATIDGELKRALRDTAWSVKVPRSLQEKSLLVGKSSEALAQSLGRPAQAIDIAKDLDLTEEEVIEAMAANSAYRWESIDEPSPITGATLADTLGDDEDWAAASADWEELADGIRTLPPRDRRILYMRFYQDMTQSEIAGELGISQMHVSRILARALEQLRAVVG
jgi:RNA polymerase sigma-B factor